MPRRDRAALDAADADRADVARVVELRDLQLQAGRSTSTSGGGQCLTMVFEQRLSCRRRGTVGSSVAKPRDGRGIHHREIELLPRSRRAGRTGRRSGPAPSSGAPRARSILLMTTIGRRPCVNAFCVTKRVCGIGPSTASTSSSTRVDHRQHALDLAAEIGVSRRVDDVDAVVVPADRRVLREDRDAAFALELVRVHDALLRRLARVERPGLPAAAGRRAWSCRGRRAR